MTTDSGLTFGVSIGPVDVPGTSDEMLYQRYLEDVDYVARLGYHGVWALEHHFSNYYPTPSPLLVLGNAAGRYPTLELGAMVVVAPWYQPLRLAGELAMLSLLTKASLHIGMGRGSAAMEYEAFNLDLDESRSRFAETMEIVKTALTSDEFTFKGKHFTIDNPIRLRPRPRLDRIHMYGAISSPETARVMAKLKLPPLSNAIRPVEMHRTVLDTWHQEIRDSGHQFARPYYLPFQAHLIIADTDEEAAALTRQYIPAFFQAQVDHYAADLARYDHLETYDMRKLHANRVHLTNPANLDGFIELNLIGTAETVKRKLQRYLDLGFNKVIVTTNTPGIPQKLRHHWLKEFADKVIPEFSPNFNRDRHIKNVA